jgi:hypothetical protein
LSYKQDDKKAYIRADNGTDVCSAVSNFRILRGTRAHTLEQIRVRKVNAQALSSEHNRCINWRNTVLDIMPVPPQSVTLIADVTFFQRSFGMCVFRSPHLRENLYCQEITREIVDIFINKEEEPLRTRDLLFRPLSSMIGLG